MPITPSLWREWLALCFKRPRPSAVAAASYPHGRCHAVAHGPITSIVVPVMVIGLLGDIPLSFVIVSVQHPPHAWLVHALITALGLAAIGWAMAVRSVARAVPHVTEDNAFWLGGGLGPVGRIPWRAIRGAQAFCEYRYAWAAAQRVRMSDAMVCSRLDSPNVAIELDEDAAGDVDLRHRGRRVAARRLLLIYADRPAELVASIRQACAGVPQAVSVED